MESVIGYLRECYREDFARSGIRDIFSESVRHRIFVDGEEHLASGFLTGVHLPPVRAAEAAVEANAYRRERELVYASIFLVGMGRMPGDEKDKPVCAPLLFYPASIEVQKDRDGETAVGASLSIDLSGRRLNGAVFSLLGAEGNALSDGIDEAFGPAAIGDREVMSVCSDLLKHDPELDDSMMASYPKLLDGAALGKFYRAMKEKNQTGTGLSLVPASCVCLRPLSRGAQGVLDELGELVESAEKGKLAAPLRVMLGGDPLPSGGETSRKADSPVVPAVLSAAQEKILFSARENTLTLVIGPPGTGKSFTIAALALDHVTRGESVLIASRNDHAVDVVAEKLSQACGHDTGVVRAGGGDYLRGLKEYLEDLLSGMFTAGEVSDEAENSAQQSLQALTKRLFDLEQELDRRSAHLRSTGRLIVEAKTDPWSRLRRWWALRGEGGGGKPLQAVGFADLQSLLEARIDLIRDYLEVGRTRRLNQALHKNRALFQALNRSIRGRTAASQEKHFKGHEFESLFSALPVWLTNLSDVHRVIPMEPELFDLVIVDEASHCDIASALPVLQRGKRVVIAGDPKQLRHLSFLSDRRQRKLFEQFGIPEEQRRGIDYRRRSLLDLVTETVTDQAQVGFLDEHFRSRSGIIGFSNREFYSGALHIMTEASSAGRQQTGPASQGLSIHQAGGMIDDRGVNEAEATQLLERLRKIVDSEKELPASMVHSLGVLSPFRKQIDYLRRTVGDTLGTNLLRRAYDAHALMFGTAHGFQGEERDIMLISLAVDQESNRQTLRYLERPDVFNVSITRARQEQHVYTSAGPAKLPAHSLLGSFLEYAVGPGSGDVAAEIGSVGSATSARDPFARELMDALAERGLKTREGYEVAGLTIDVLAVGEKEAIGIDLIGYPGRFHEVFPFERYRMFFRAGLRIMPLAYVEWRLRREECLEAIVGSLGDEGGNHGIH